MYENLLYTKWIENEEQKSCIPMTRLVLTQQNKDFVPDLLKDPENLDLLQNNGCKSIKGFDNS